MEPYVAPYVQVRHAIHLLYATSPRSRDALGEELRSPLPGPDHRALSRTLYPLSDPFEPDGQGRISLLPEQRRLAGIETPSTVVVIGAGSRVEIWPEARWDSYSADAQGRFTEFADRVISGH